MPHIPSEDCHVEPVLKEVDPQRLERSVTAMLGVVGMGCPTCATRVRNGLLSWPAVLQVEIDLEHGLARIRYEPDQTSCGDLLKAVAAAGDDRHAYRAILLT